jgi:hypothetical protein
VRSVRHGGAHQRSGAATEGHELATKGGNRISHGGEEEEHPQMSPAEGHGLTVEGDREGVGGVVRPLSPALWHGLCLYL